MDINFGNFGYFSLSCTVYLLWVAWGLTVAVLDYITKRWF